MRVGFSTFNPVACQPLKFGKVESAPNQNPQMTPAQYEARIQDLELKYDFACRLACAQADQYNKYVAGCDCCK